MPDEVGGHVPRVARVRGDRRHGPCGGLSGGGVALEGGCAVGDPWRNQAKYMLIDMHPLINFCCHL